MHTRRRIISLASCGLALVSLSATRFIGAASRNAVVTHAAPVACKLLTASDASAALEVQSRPGKQIVDATSCVWSNDPAVSDSSRRVTLVTHFPIAFRAAMHPAIMSIKIEPVAGIGDQAFYQIYPNDQPPFIWVRKGDNVFDIRIITRTKPSPFTIEQEKAKEAVLAKAVVAKL